MSLLNRSRPLTPAIPCASTSWRSLLRRSSQGSLAILALSGSLPLLTALQAEALPNGAQIQRGRGTVSGDADRLTVRTNGRTVISWQSFNIEAGKLVDFQNDKAVLNYVRLGGGPSRIDGNLRATNPIILLNNQGISIGRTALISAPSVLLSTGSLLPDSMDKFIQGVNDGNGLNAPLISIQLSNGNGAISVEGAIRSSNGGGIGLIAPTISIGPTATLQSLGSRTAASGSDGVNITVNGVEAKGSLWLGTTGLSLTPYTQPIAGMPGTALPTLPTGFGFTQVSGKPSPQRIELALQASYDFERVVIGSSGALPGQFDGLFFSPNFRVTDFYVYDGIEAVEEGHRQATVGGLRRSLVNVQTNQLIDDQLESTILGLQLPPGASLMAATDISLDGNGQLQSGNLLISPPATLSQDFVQQFGAGAFTIKIAGGQGSLEGSNGAKASYNPSTGQVNWVRVTQGPPISETIRVTGNPIPQGVTTAPTGLVLGQGTTTQYTAREGYYYHGKNGTYAGTTPCSGCRYMNPVTGEVSYWKGHFSSDSNGHQHFVQDPRGSSVVYSVGGRFYVTDASTFDPKTTPKAPPAGGTSFTPDMLQTVTRPGPTTQVSYSEVLPIRGNGQGPSGNAVSSWTQPTQPPSQVLTPPLPVVAPTAAPPLTTYAVPEPSQAVPSPTTAVATAAEKPSFSGSNPVIQPQQGPGISGYAPYAEPSPTAPVPTPAPTLAPNPTQAVPIPRPNLVPQPTPSAPVEVPTARPTLAPNPTQAVPTPKPNLVPTPTPSAPVEVPTARPTLAPNPTQAVPTPRPNLVPQPTPSAPVEVPSARPTLAPNPTQAVPTPKPNLVPQPTPSAPVEVPSARPTLAPNPTQAVPTPRPNLVPQPTPSVPVEVPTARPTLAPNPTQAVASPVQGPSLSGSNPVIQPQQGQSFSGYAPYNAPGSSANGPTPTPGGTSLIPQPTPSVTIEVPRPRPTGLPGTSTGGNPTPTPGGTGLIPQPTPSVSVDVPTPRPAIAPGATTAGPRPQPTPPLLTTTTTGGMSRPSGTGPSGTARQAVIIRPEIRIPSPGTEGQRPAQTLTYQVPKSVVEASIPGGIASRSRATLADGRPLPAELDYDPTSQTFTITNTELLPLPLDVMLRMPTRTGGEGSVTLTIGRP